MPHRRMLYNMDGLNSGMNLSQDYSGYLANLTPDENDASQQFDNTLSIPWSCEGGTCNCASINTMSAAQPSLCTNSLPSTSESCMSTEGDSYIKYSFPSPTDSTAIAVQQIKEGLCPLATGATNECVPQLCGTNPPCEAFWTVPEIEECGEVPCLIKPDDQSSQSQQEPVAPRRQSSPSPAKKVRRDSGESTSTRSRKSTSDKRNPTVEQTETKDSPKHDKKAKSKPVDPKQAHSLVEKRYRENLNAKISELHNVLLSTPDGSPSETCQTRKSEILQTAIDYVNQTQLEMRHMTNDIDRLNARVRALEKVVRCEDCSLLKGFDGLRVLPGASGLAGIGNSYGMAATSAV